MQAINCNIVCDYLHAQKQYSLISTELCILASAIGTIYSPGRCSAGLHTTCVPPPEVPRGCGLKGRGQGWTGPRGAKVTRVDSVMSRGNWQQVCSGGQGAWGRGRVV